MGNMIEYTMNMVRFWVAGGDKFFKHVVKVINENRVRHHTEIGC